MRYIFTCQVNATKYLISEFKREDKSFRFIDWLDAGVGLMESELTLDEFSELIIKTPIIFVRHIFEAQFSIELSPLNDLITTTQINNIFNESMEFILSNLHENRVFTVQGRTISNDLYKEYKRDFIENINIALIKSNYIMDTKNFDQIISIFIAKKVIYIGYSLTNQNLSNWNGGMMHCARENTQISRAGSKLMEAIDIFNIPLKDFKYSIDLGAAPGGWTEVLLNNNLEVTAIDPSEMDSTLLKNPKLTHYKETAQQFLMRDISKEYDIILNDMKMDILPSVKIINKFSDLLSNKGIIIMTFKLPHKFNYTLIKEGINELQNNYNIITARQLFHNRSEITIIGKRSY